LYVWTEWEWEWEWEWGGEASGWDEGERGWGEERVLEEVEWWEVGWTEMGLERGWRAVYVTCWDGVLCYGLDGGFETRIWVLRILLRAGYRLLPSHERICRNFHSGTQRKAELSDITK